MHLKSSLSNGIASRDTGSKTASLHGSQDALYGDQDDLCGGQDQDGISGAQDVGRIAALINTGDPVDGEEETIISIDGVLRIIISDCTVKNCELIS